MAFALDSRKTFIQIAAAFFENRKRLWRNRRKLDGRVRKAFRESEAFRDTWSAVIVILLVPAIFPSFLANHRTDEDERVERLVALAAFPNVGPIANV